MKPDYGIDAPGVRRGMLIAGVVCLFMAGLAIAVATSTVGLVSEITLITAAVAALAMLYGLGMAAYMTYASRLGKLRTRERLLDLVATVIPWTGREAVLDVGCGRGLMLIGAARRLTTGRATGIDLWRAVDQADNTADAALENARCEGVAERINVHTGDARSLPFPDATFDVVLSHWVIHNLPDASDRARAVAEMVRVLRPEGALVLADIAHYADYRRQLELLSLQNIIVDTGGAESRIIGALSGGSFCPHAIIGRRAALHMEN
ncbi:class I SAM-dependent methyltransferase [Lichenifustis flavocetrariae]|uniref:Class I SAM-dependent methyltransferase n=1 Tax=Lichenifustis flavocetrariae TaxID=2949735 RepID=A0AA42CM89_9HYPH|nr:class I SAM-dependent methyltransferase [Lichenifustis flavocetrariae]MCW6511296.1 class I SAM-dependent methyltransferase [Lichenifustis flavocetrariae]